MITTAPNFPSGRIFPGFKNKLWQSEDMDGVRVIRVWTYITANSGFLKRTLDYVSFMVTGALAALFVRNVDVIVATSPQFFTAIAGFVVSVLKRRPWAFELRDLWPESIKAVGAMNDGIALRALVRVEEFLYRHANAIVCVTRSFRQHLVARGVDAGKISVITNGVELGQFSPRARSRTLAQRYGLADSFVAGYVGTHGMAHGLETLLEAARLLGADATAANIRLVLLGDGAEKAKLKTLATGLDNVTFIDSVTKAEVPDHWALLDVSIIHLKRNDLFKTVIPSKIFESMAMGLPVVLAVEGEAADIVRQENVGVLVAPEDGAALAAAIKRLASDTNLRAGFSERGLAAARRYDRRRLARAMLNDLEDVAARRALSRVEIASAEKMNTT